MPPYCLAKVGGPRAEWIRRRARCDQLYHRQVVTSADGRFYNNEPADAGERRRHGDEELWIDGQRVAVDQLIMRL